MATALQQQLAAIAEKSTHQLDLKAQRTQHGQSLLFEAKDAANQTFDTIYDIAVDGVEELCSLDKRFIPFTRTLFSEQSKSEDRTQMTAAENEELDRVIQSFLGLVCGRLLLRPAQKAMEWLVRRFRIQEYNTEYFVLTFLPYHENDMFPTMLSLLPQSRQLPVSMKFLAPYIKSLATPPRHSVLYNMINNATFSALLNRFALGTCKEGHQSATLLGFWASIMAQAISGQLDGAQSGRAEIRKQREEEVLLRVLPQLQEALQIRDVPELYLGCCMITVILVTKLTLEDEVLGRLMDAIASSWTLHTVNDGLACLAVISQERKAFRLPRVTAKKLLCIDQIAIRLGDLASRYPVGRLWAGICLKTLSSSAIEVEDCCHRFLASPFIESSTKRSLVNQLVQTCVASSSENADNGRTNAAQLIKSVHGSSKLRHLLLDSLTHSTVAMADLEQACGQPLRLEAQGNVGAGSEVDDSSADDAMETSGNDFDMSSLAAIKDDIRQAESFLSTESTPLYTKLYAAFSSAVAAKVDMKVLAGVMTNGATDHAATLPLLTFCIRCWTTGTPPSIVRATTVLGKHLAQSIDADMQALLAYCYIPLAHEHQAVRRCAAEIVGHIATVYKRSERAKKIGTMQVFVKDNLYGGNSHAIKWMKSTDAFSVVTEAINDALEECVVDRSAIGRILVSCIDGTDDDLELKSTVRSALYTNLASLTMACPLLRSRMALLPMLQTTGKASAAGRKHVVVPAIKEWCTMQDKDRASLCSAEGLTLAAVDLAYTDCLSSETEDEVELLRSITLGTLPCSKTIQDLASNRFRKLWSSINVRQQTHISRELMDSVLATESSSSAGALALLKSVKLSGDTLVSLLQDVHGLAAMPEGPPSAKRRRTSSSKVRSQEVDLTSANKIVQQLTVVLELVESSKPERHPELLKLLFHILGDIQQVKSQLGSDLIYVQQMALGSILALVESLKSMPASKVDRSALRIDLLVDCMRSTSSTQIHNAALLLIASLAGWASDLVLHNVMPIFTFMSSNILRQGDDYSAHIIDQTVSQVIPPLVASLRKKNQDLVTGAAELLLSFIAAYEHMPMHRRLQILRQVVEALGPEESLSAVMAMLFERYPSDRRTSKFCVDLAGHFAKPTQIKAVVQYLDLVADAMQPRRTVSQAIFSFEQDSPAEVQVATRSLVSLLAEFLRDPSFIERTRQTLCQNGEEALSTRQAATTLIDRSIGFAKTVDSDADLQASSKRVVVAVLNLLPTPQFISAITPLLEDPDEALGTNILGALETRAQSARPGDEQTRTVMLEILPHVCKLVQTSTIDSVKYGAVAAIDKIVEKYGKKNLSAAVGAAQVVASDACLGSSNVNLQIVALFSLATMVEVLRDDMISILPGTFEKTLQCLQHSWTGKGNSRLYEACFAMLGAITEHLPWAMSAKILAQVIVASMEAARHPDLAAATARVRSDFFALAVKRVNISLLVDATDGSIERSFEAPAQCRELLDVVDKVVTNATKANVSKNSSRILAGLRRFMDVRTKSLPANEDDDVLESELDQIDKQRDSIMMKAVMKLNDTTFRPFFVDVVEWSHADDAEGDADMDDVGNARLLSLYGFLTTFFDTLKSLVTSYTSYILQPCADLMGQLSPSNNEDRMLLTTVLKAMVSSFSHDQDDFWQAPSHFDAMLSPLVSQLRQSKTIGKEDTVGIIPTVTEFAAAATSPDHLKALNTELLKMMRGRETHVRLAAVKTERSLTEKLGEDWLALLPEMLPIISELQEDEDEVVERETLGWIKEIEGVLGESLEGMLQ